MTKEAVDVAIEALKQLEQKNDKKFIELVVEYPDSAICPYPDYKGKPYFLIRYEENGEKIEGFGTYKPEVLSKYIREYFMGEKKGKWIDYPISDVCLQCSCCGILRMGDPSNYCPNCGAEMENPE